MELNKVIQTVEHLKLFIKKVKRYEKVSDQVTYGEMTIKRREKLEAEMNWLAMELQQMEIDAHVFAVELGIAKERGEKYYDTRQFQTGAFQVYPWTPRKPFESRIINSEKEQ